MIDVVISLSVLVLVFITVFSKDNITSITSFAVFSFLVSIIWLKLNSIDLAMVEILTGTIISMLAFYFHFRYSKENIYFSLSSLWWVYLIVVLIVSHQFFSFLKTVDYNGSLVHLVQQNLSSSGSKSDVTAVLLNFRGYDTLLEIAVISTLPIGIKIFFDYNVKFCEFNIEKITHEYLKIILPLLIMISGYVLLSGTTVFGGAFQAGLLGSIFLYLYGIFFNKRIYNKHYFKITQLGFVSFILIGLITIIANDTFLKFRQNEAFWFMTLIEIAVAISISLIFYESFILLIGDDHE